MSIEQRTALSEAGRKLVHIAFGLGAFFLPFLTWPQALLLAVAAIIHNRFILPIWMGRQIARDPRGHDPGILIYPVVVFFLILIFRDQLWIAAVCWALLAFGDGCASLVGRNVPSRPLPWNRGKSVAGLLAHMAAGIPLALVAGWWNGASAGFLPWPLIIVIGGVVAALVESFEPGLDDNLTQTAASAFSVALLSAWVRVPALVVSATAASWLVINLLLAVVGYYGRAVSTSGAIGGVILGSCLILWGGWPIYVVLLLFFVIGSGVTKLGWREKKTLGLEQESDGRRGASHAFANAGTAALCMLAVASTEVSPGLMWLAAVASLATATADTTGSEIGQWIGRRAFLPLSLRRVVRGTEGAISVEGTMAGAAAGFLVAACGMLLLAWKGRAFETVSFNAGLQHAAAAIVSPTIWQGIAIAGASAVLASYGESIVGSWNRGRSLRIPNGVMNFMNTLAGAALALALAFALGYEI